MLAICAYTEKRMIWRQDGHDLIGLKVGWNSANVRVIDVLSCCPAHRIVHQLKPINHIICLLGAPV